MMMSSRECGERERIPAGFWQSFLLITIACDAGKAIARAAEKSYTVSSQRCLSYP